MPFDFGTLVLDKHVREFHTSSEHNELSEHDKLEVLQISLHQFRTKPNEILSANSTASGLYAPGQVRTKIWNFGSLFQFSNVADVNEVIAAATLDILRHGDGETMSELAYRAGPGGGRGVLLRLEPLHQEAVNMTWGMWRSALGDITGYYDKVGKVPIDFSITYSIGLRDLLIGDGSLVHDLCGGGDEGLVMEQVA